jgi:hypothetical protein
MKNVEAANVALPLSDENILRFAMRYALGRKTAAPEIVVTKIKELWPRIRPYTQDQMKREIAEHINQKIAGDSCDEETWRRVLRLPNKDSATPVA